MFFRPAVPTVIDTPRLSTYIDEVVEEFTVDLLMMDTGEVLGVNGESVCLYANRDTVFTFTSESVLAMISLSTR